MGDQKIADEFEMAALANTFLHEIQRIRNHAVTAILLQFLGIRKSEAEKEAEKQAQHQREEAMRRVVQAVDVLENLL